MRLAGYAEENLCYYKIIRTNKFFHEITSNLSILRILGTGRWLRRYRIKNGEIDMYKILVVDDDPIILDDNQTFFRTMGYDVICSSTAAHAEEIILSNALDCVILDVDLPDRNGFSLCEKMQTLQLKGTGTARAGAHTCRKGCRTAAKSYLWFVLHKPGNMQCKL